ncbi:hypothetical protein BD410DRAFT_866225 [Rickenella mellea]|uniref:Prenyltransferase alpha-alpha toroid domain-containing protein n=1 Tax=Rickenella mellea TaxID=50990 RepID=A0A4Y7PIC2_9AGAM|nr:hypothetical protein BD410DRAFT_866225 [Rickenella mellea]
MTCRTDSFPTATSKEQARVEEILLQHRPPNDQPKPHLQRPEHLNYLLRNLRQGFPERFISQDCSQTWLVYWTLHSFSLLGVALDPETKQRIGLSCERRAIDTIMACQHPDGGFGGGPGQAPHPSPGQGKARPAWAGLGRAKAFLPCPAHHYLAIIKLTTEKMQAAERILLGHKCEIPEWLVYAHAYLVMRKKILSMEEARELGGLQFALNMTLARERAREQYSGWKLNVENCQSIVTEAFKLPPATGHRTIGIEDDDTLVTGLASSRLRGVQIFRHSWSQAFGAARACVDVKICTKLQTLLFVDKQLSANWKMIYPRGEGMAFQWSEEVFMIGVQLYRIVRTRTKSGTPIVDESFDLFASSLVGTPEVVIEFAHVDRMFLPIKEWVRVLRRCRGRGSLHPPKIFPSARFTRSVRSCAPSVFVIDLSG